MQTPAHQNSAREFFRISILLLLIFCGTGLKAQQSISYTVLKAFCNGDGELAIEAPGNITPPMDVVYYDQNGDTIYHGDVNSNRDTLRAITVPIEYIYVFANGFSASAEVNMTVFTIDPGDIEMIITCPEKTAEVNITIDGGKDPASVEWYDLYSGDLVNTGNPIELGPDYYKAKVIDSDGCYAFTKRYITYMSDMQVVTSVTAASCTNGKARVVTVENGVEPYTYLWTNGATSSEITGLSSGAYEVTVTDSRGCYETGRAFVQQNPYVGLNYTVTPATCKESDGKVMFFATGGTPPYTFTCDNGMSGQQLSGLSTGQYSVIVKDKQGCTGELKFYVSASTPITATYTTTKSSCTAATGSATLQISGGQAPYTVRWNTWPAASGTTANNLAPGIYSFEIEDANGCARSGSVQIEPQSVVNAIMHEKNPVCPQTTGELKILADGDNPPFSYNWSNGATTASISAVQGQYSCTVTDNVGCKITKYGWLMMKSDIQIGFNSKPASCIYTADGSITAQPSGGTAPYTYRWSNGQTGQTVSNLGTGRYWVHVEDAEGCRRDAYVNLGYDPSEDNCYCTVTGRAFVDENENCVLDPGEKGIPNLMIKCDGLGYTFTRADGVYSFKVPTGTYTLSQSIQSTYPLAACQSNSNEVSVTAASGCQTTVNFANVVNPLHDIHLTRTNVNFAIPGNKYYQKLIVANDGAISEDSIQMGYRTDGQLTMAPLPPYYTQKDPGNESDWYSVEKDFPVLEPGEGRAIVFEYDVPTNIPLGTELLFKDTAAYKTLISNWLNDESPWNNVTNCQTTVIGSYDPNFIEVSPAGADAPGYIETTDSVLDYTIHFQNTGSYYAEKVVVVDTIDPDLDLSTLKTGYSDHSYVADVTEDGVLTFTFDHIHLPWQDLTELGSCGLVTFSIKQKKGLSPLTRLTSKAGIYFDYNAPVITNEALNTIRDHSGVEEKVMNPLLIVYPNPANDLLALKIEAERSPLVIHIYDLQGRKVSSQPAAESIPVQKISLKELKGGFYMVEVEYKNGEKQSGKFVKN